MAHWRNKRDLLRDLESLAAPAETQGLELLERVEQCPSAKHASALLAHVVRATLSQHEHGESLLPKPGWIHPFI
jgi:hypothetical protein